MLSDITIKDNKCIEKRSKGRKKKSIFFFFFFSKREFRSYACIPIYVCVRGYAVGAKKGHCVRIATKAPNVIFHTSPYLETPCSPTLLAGKTRRLPHPGLNPWNLYRQVKTEYKRQWPRAPKLSRNIGHFLRTAIEAEYIGEEDGH